MSQWWTSFELGWYYFWTCVTFLAMFTPRIGFFSVAWSNGLGWVSHASSIPAPWAVEVHALLSLA